MEKIKFEPFEFEVFGINSLLEIDMNEKHESGRTLIKFVKKVGSKGYLPFATISQDIPDVELAEGEFIVNNWNVYCELLDFLMENTNYFIDTQKRVPSKYEESPIWKINFEM